MKNPPDLIRQLLKIVVAHTWFFETCDEEVVDDRTAIKQQEHAAYLLGQLSEADKSWLTDELAALAATETDPAYREFLTSYSSPSTIAKRRISLPSCRGDRGVLDRASTAVPIYRDRRSPAPSRGVGQRAY
ncbi:MAG: hypothetical protein JWN03_3823 [Nocardia sp.]|nr:hypothetical protein [Nocardia sp.]